MGVELAFAAKKFGVFGAPAAAPGILLPKKLGTGLVLGLGGSPPNVLAADDAPIGGVVGLAKKLDGEDAVIGALKIFPDAVAGLPTSPEVIGLVALV